MNAKVRTLDSSCPAAVVPAHSGNAELVPFTPDVDASAQPCPTRIGSASPPDATGPYC